jgi:hypothetical protein
MVAIRGDLVAAVIARRGLTVAALARKLGREERQQTLDLIARGVTTRCRASRRKRIARALGVPDAWLGGAAWTGGVFDDPRVIPAGEARAFLARQDLWLRCVEAWERDWRELGKAPPDPVEAGLFLAIVGLVDASLWRQRLVRPDEPSAWPRLRDGRDLSVEDRDAAGTALATAVAAILRPWLDGEARLNYAWLKPRSVRPDVRPAALQGSRRPRRGQGAPALDCGCRPGLYLCTAHAEPQHPASAGRA